MDEILLKAKKYIENLTIDSAVNLPADIVRASDRFFTWDHEKRSIAKDPYLFDYSYYNGVVFEGLFDIFEQTKDKKIFSYVKEYLDALLTENEEPELIFERAGYVDDHGADCYKTANLLVRMGKYEKRYLKVAERLYRDLTDPTHRNRKGRVNRLEYCDTDMGGNYWHLWSNSVPKYKLWLDGLYMIQPFLASYAKEISDRQEMERIQKRLDWVSTELLSSSGLYYHAGNSAFDVCPYFWLRAMGWYGMAMVDVMPLLPKSYLPARKKNLDLFVRGMLRYQHSNGMWTNLVDLPISDANRLETSGTSMMVYTILKGVRLGYLNAQYREKAVLAFRSMVTEKLTDVGLQDIYFKASANGFDNYQNPQDYLTDEGKGVGPFIMAYSEMLLLKSR